MSPGEDEISAALPRPPPASPARREAAIAAAMRRFDGVEAAEPAAPAWTRRPYLGALAGAALVALIALPLAWTSFDEQPYRDARKPPPARTAPGPAAPAAARTEVDPPAPGRVRVPAAAPDEAPVAAPSDSSKAFAPPPPPSPPPPPPPPDAEPAPAWAEEQAGKAGGEELVVTGTRIRRPNLQSATPVTVLDSASAPAARRAAAAAPPARRGDWNACTVEDPARRLAGCRVTAETADGLERAWRGDWEGAASAFDSAVAAAPRSSQAWLNRALVRRRSGELEQALADLDRAVRFSPRAARFHYHRSLVLRQLGDSARAEADEARAVELDPRYAGVVPAQGRR
jgi:hypothetical protein